jgi:hypothetical protein
MANLQNLVTAKAGSIIGENLKLSLATPAGSITPATLTAMVGIAKGEALDLAPTVKNAMSAMDSKISALISANTAPSLALAAKISSAKSALTGLQSSLGVTGSAGTSNLGNFGSILSQAQSHIQDATEIKSVQNFLSSSKFADFGSGITNMSTLTTRGLDAQFGSLTAAASALAAAGPCFDMANPGSIGSGAGLIDKLKSVKLGNFSGLNQALASNGVDLDRMDDPVYSETITKTLSSISDPKILKDVTTQLGINPPGGIASGITLQNPFAGAATEAGFNQGAVEGSITQGISTASTVFGSGQVPTNVQSASGIKSLNDLTDISKLASPSAVAGLTGGLSSIATKFSDLGARFPSPAAAAGMLKNIEIPSIPSLNSAASSLSSYMSGLAPDIKSLTGSGFGASALNGIGDLPNISDFTHVVSGGPELAALASSAAAMTEAQIDALSNSLTKSQNLLSKAGIDLTSLPGTNLSSSLNFATSLHKYGADLSGSGIADTLKSMAKSGSQYGDAIKASLAEGKNKALMMANSIKPPNFGETPFKNFPSAGSDNSLSGGSALLGGS